jgi:hypothetical protein
MENNHGQLYRLDVSLKERAISVRRDGKRVWRGKCASDPAVVARVIRERAPDAAPTSMNTVSS